MAAPSSTGAIVLNQTQLQNRFDRQHRRPFSRNRLRRRDIEKIIDDRHGIVPETDDADIYLIAAATCFGRITRESGKRPTHEVFAIWCEKWAPHFGDAEQADILDHALDNHSLRADDDWGRLLRLSDAERTRLGITTIGSYDVDRKARVKRSAARKREQKRLRTAEKRRANGAIPRDVYEAQSLARTKPWESMGISQRTYMRRKAATVGTGVCPHPSYSKGTLTCAKTDSQAPATTQDGICLTTPPAKAVGTHSKTIWYEVVDGVAVVGDDRKRFKTRFPTSMRLSKEARAYALAACFEPAKVDRMFEIFRDCNIGMGSWSRDWDEVWRNWVDREVDIANEANTKAWRARARAYAQAA